MAVPVSQRTMPSWQGQRDKYKRKKPSQPIPFVFIVRGNLFATTNPHGKSTALGLCALARYFALQ
jgi:hypothetical protein